MLRLDDAAVTGANTRMDKFQRIIFAGVIVLALIPRLVRVQYGLPYVDYWDEAQVPSASQRMLSEPSFFTTFFNYGNLPIYFAVLLGLPVFLFFLARGKSLAPNDLMPYPDYSWGFEYGELLLAARLGWALLGVLTVVAVFLLTRRLAGFYPAVLAGAALAINPMHLELSTRVPPDGLATSIAFGSLGFALLYLWKKNPSLLYLSVAFGALAAATKYNYGTVVFAAVVSYLLVSGGSDWKARFYTLVRLGITAGLTFAIAMPSAVAHPRLFVGAVLFEVNHYQTGHLGHESEPWIGQIVFQSEALLGNWGWSVLLLAALGLLGLLFFEGGIGRKVAMILTVPYIPFFFVMLSGTVNFHRNYLLVYPVIALLAGIGVAYLVKLIGRVALRSSISMAAQSLVVIGLLVVALLPNLSSTISSTTSFAQGQDSRSTLVEVLKEGGICERYSLALVESRLFLNQREWAEACPDTELERFESGSYDFEVDQEPLLVLGIKGFIELENPTLEINAGRGYAERDGKAFGPNFSPPIAVYLLNTPD